MTEKKDQKDHTSPLKCSFCGKVQDEVKKLIAGPSVLVRERVEVADPG